VVATREAVEVVQSFAPKIPISLIPDGVGLEPVRGGAQPVLPPVVVFSSPLHGARNFQDVTDFCRDIVPIVSAAVPACRFVIVSQDQPPHMGQLALPPSVRLVAGVSDVRPTLRRASLAVAPIRNAAAHPATLLEPMAAALPVVATSAACEGLRLEPGRHLYVADDAAAFGRRIIELLTSASLRAEMATGGCSFVETEGSWEVMGSRINDLVTGVVKGTSAGPSPSLPSLALGG
jgi:glycosyltransferase involved in cell wall biosynthesis